MERKSTFQVFQVSRFPGFLGDLQVEGDVGKGAALADAAREGLFHPPAPTPMCSHTASHAHMHMLTHMHAQAHVAPVHSSDDVQVVPPFSPPYFRALVARMWMCLLQ
jgi:hypothetical protein